MPGRTARSLSDVRLDRSTPPERVRYARDRDGRLAHGALSGDRGHANHVSAEPSPPAPRRSTFLAFRHRHYRVLWVAFFATFMGLQMQLVANVWLAFELTDSFTQAGLVALAWGIPMLALTLVGGAVADRFDRRTLTLYAQSLNSLIVLVTFGLVLADAISVTALFITALFHGSIFALNMPGRQAQVADVVPPADLGNAVALSVASQNVTRILGPAAAGITIALTDVEVVYLLISAMYVLTVGLQLLLPRHAGRTTQQRAGMRREIVAGVRYIAADRQLRLLMVIALVPTILGMPFIILLAGFASEELELADSGFGILLAVNGAGAIVGSLVIARLADFPRKPLMQIVMIVGAGVGLLALGFGSAAFGAPAAFVAVAILGVTLTAYQTLNNTMIMQISAPAYHGRVMSVVMVTMSTMPLMGFPLGVIADEVGATAVFSAQGLLVLGFAVIALASAPGYLLGRMAATTARVEERAAAEVEPAG